MVEVFRSMAKRGTLLGKIDIKCGVAEGSPCGMPAPSHANAFLCCGVCPVRRYHRHGPLRTPPSLSLFLQGASSKRDP